MASSRTIPKSSQPSATPRSTSAPLDCSSSRITSPSASRQAVSFGMTVQSRMLAAAQILTPTGRPAIDSPSTRHRLADIIQRENSIFPPHFFEKGRVSNLSSVVGKRTTEHPALNAIGNSSNPSWSAAHRSSCSAGRQPISGRIYSPEKLLPKSSMHCARSTPKTVTSG